MKCGRVTNLNGVTPTGDYFCCLDCENGVYDGANSELVEQENRRRVFFSYKIYRINFPAGSYVNSYRIDIKMRGEKRNWLGRWKSYKTVYQYRNLTGTSLSYDVRGVSAQIPNGLPWYSIEPFDFGSDDSGEYSSYTWTFPIYVDEHLFNASLYTGARLTEPWFDSFNIEYSSRGFSDLFSYSNE